MGFFSFITLNTGISIANVHSPQYTIPVVMILPDGTMYKEEAYQGYGVFGGKDYYVAMAEINGYTEEKMEELAGKTDDPQQRLREVAIWGTAGRDDEYAKKVLESHNIKPIENPLYPQLLEIIDGDFSLEDIDFTKPAKQCEFQGFFY